MTPTTEVTEEKASKKTKLVPIELIDAYREDHVRAEPLKDKIEEYREIIKEHGHMEPIDLFRDDGRFRLSHGWTRFDAYVLEGRKEIPAFIHDGSRSDAIKLDITKTCRSGTPATNADKRKAAMLAVTDPELGEMADAKIAKQIGVSVALVASARKGETPAQATNKKKEKAAKSNVGQVEPTGKRETESPAPRPAATRERAPADVRPTKAAILRQIEEHLRLDVIEEADLLKIMESKDGEWKWVKKSGETTILRVVAGNGREQIAIDAVVKEFTADCITLRCLDGKVSYEPKEA